MSKVALRLYVREIETLIDQGHNDEAVAHCQHILKTYPKHLETYRLLGKAYLEAHRYVDAADIFQRVLLAVPDDFVSHLGMSIVCDEQKDLDGAIWHMERAFEISSTNAGVQGELRRLRGRRDGMEPPKIQLTRGALAQIYAKGGEYEQAITEIKAVLAEDNTRLDMKTLLARAYFHAGMRNEATEACIELLKQYPYSLDGNRILVEILPGTSMAQGVEQYKRRIESLDPYLAMVTGSTFETEGIPDNAVTIERLEWDPNSQPVASWNMPDTGASKEPEKAPEAPAEEIPDWMKQSGWGQATGEFKDGPVNFDEPEPAAPEAGGELAAAEIPDWLKAMAPPGATASEPASTPPNQAVESADFDWLAGLGAPTGGETAEQAAPIPAEPVSSAVPPAGTEEGSDNDLDWLNNLGSAAAPAAAAGLAADEGLDWLNNLTPPQEEKPAQLGDVTVPAEEALPDWLSAMNEPQPAALAPEITPEQPVSEAAPEQLGGFGESPVEIPAAELPAEPPTMERTPDWSADFSAPQAPEAVALSESEPVPDWLKDLSGAGAEPPLSDLVSGPGTSAAEQDESLNWLEGLAQKQGAKSEELITNPSDRSETIPDWVSKVEETPVEPKAQAPAEYIPEKPIEAEAEPMEGELSPLVSGPGTTESEQDDAFKWLENLAAGQGAKSEELLTKPEERKEHVPGWVGEVESQPAELSSLISGPGTSSSEQDDALLWLESLAQKQGAKPEELITNPDARTENAPDWVGQVGQVPDQVVQPELVQETPPPPPVEEVKAQVPPPPAPVEEVKPPVPPVARKAGEEEFVPGPLSELVFGPGTTESEQDAALLWLESLAQKQGAKPEELITKPESRTENAPEWVAQVGQEPAVSTEPAAPVETPSVPAEVQSEESLAWLQELSAEEPVAAEQPVEPSPVEQQPAVEQPVDQDWMKDLDTAAAGATAGAAADEGLSWLNDLSKPAEETPPTLPWDQLEETAIHPAPEPQAVEPVTPPVPSEIPDWLADLGQAEAPEQAESMPWEQPPEQAVVPPALEPQTFEEPAATVGSETSQWLTNLEQGETVEQPEAMPWEQETPAAEAGHPEPVPEEQPQAVEETTHEATGITDWLKNLDVQEEAVSSDAEQPVTESEELPDWLKGTSEDEQPPVPEPAQGWMPTDESPAQPPAEVEMPASLLAPQETATPAPVESVPAAPEAAPAPVEVAPSKAQIPEPVAEAAPSPLPQRPALRQTGMLGGDKDALAVRRARDLLGRGGLDVAMSEYTRLIKKGKLLEEVIYDLQEAVYSHPVDVIVWQTLGDAFVRSNRLQDALDAYNKAEELLR